MTAILVVEDSERIASFVAKGLRAAGFTPTVTASAREAFDLGCSGEFDLMVLDLSLPDGDGLDVARRLRAAGAELAIIILTARDTVTDTVAGLEGGADDYMPSRSGSRSCSRASGCGCGPRPRAATRARTSCATATSSSTCARVGPGSRDARSSSRHVSSRSPRRSCATPGRCSAASSCCPGSGGTTSTPARTSSTSTSGTCDASSARSS